MLCQICESPEPLVRDHDHATNEDRGYICRRCNAVLGYAADDADRLRRAAAFLETTERRPRGKLGEPVSPRRDRAAYMREYRARRAQRAVEDMGVDGATERILELEEEVRRLKRELARREVPAGPTFSSRPFRPVPKRSAK